MDKHKSTSRGHIYSSHIENNVKSDLLDEVLCTCEMCKLWYLLTYHGPYSALLRAAN